MPNAIAMGDTSCMLDVTGEEAAALAMDYKKGGTCVGKSRKEATKGGHQVVGY
jgi:hypothetical protein